MASKPARKYWIKWAGLLRVYPTTPIGLDQEAGYAALNRGSLEITPDDVNKAMQNEGEDYRRQYQFINALIRTYVLLRGLQEVFIGEDTMQRFEHADDYATVRGRQARLL
tara:strand:- start:226 stop:555 length:330 start_codon:yes stop_codon:yes gene_type:complete